MIVDIIFMLNSRVLKKNKVFLDDGLANVMGFRFTLLGLYRAQRHQPTRRKTTIARTLKISKIPIVLQKDTKELFTIL